MKSQSYLNKTAQKIFKLIHEHCKSLGISNDIDTFELSMLANSFALYASCAQYCSDNGVYQEVGQNGYKQVTPEYTVMNKEYGLILKHSSKFGLNPADRDKLTKIAKQEEEEDFNDL